MALNAKQKITLRAAILAGAWRHIEEYGPAALSLRAIARALGVTAPAIYNYYSRRDDLVTALVIDAFTSFGDAQIAACESVPADDLVGRLNATGMAYRRWALANPQRFRLIFGTPIRGYIVPPDKVMPAATRALAPLVSVVEALRVAGILRLEESVPVAPKRLRAFADWKRGGVDVDIRSFSIAILIWARAHGLVSLEVNGALPPFGPAPKDLFRREMEAVSRQFLR